MESKGVRNKKKKKSNGGREGQNPSLPDLTIEPKSEKRSMRKKLGGRKAIPELGGKKQETFHRKKLVG